ncbi:MAG: alpha-hydroxy acid oxidase [Pseudonocardiales bacterium]
MPIVCVEDYEPLARERLPAPVWDYIEGGAGAELTLHANRAAFDRTSIRPRVLVDVSRCDTTTTVLGSTLRSPIIVAPTAFHAQVHPDAEPATARGAAAAGSLLVASTLSSRPIEEISAAVDVPMWFQLYLLRDRGMVADMTARARSAGCRALVLTVDTPRLGRRLRDERNSFAVAPGTQPRNLSADLAAAPSHRRGEGVSALAATAADIFDQTITWSDLGWLRSLTDLPLLLKGVVTAADAALAVEHGMDGIIVSNHGGRQLDGGIASLRALPEVVGAVAGRCPVLVDGGVRRGRDVFIALALGADAVLVGRPVLWGLAVGGADGVEHVLSMLTRDLEHTMALAGRPTVADIGRDAVD